MGEEYWNEYNSLQFFKHKILENYLNAWFPILSSFSGQINYVDCFAGRGKHNTGQKGSPLVAIETLLSHKSKDKILRNCKIKFVFIEKNNRNANELKKRVKNYNNSSSNVKIEVFNEDYESRLNKLLDSRIKDNPAFYFIDPFTYRISLSLINKILKCSKSEVLINFMYRYALLASSHKEQERNLNRLFGSNEWKYCLDIENTKDKEEQLINLFKEKLRAKYTINVPFLMKNNATKYHLVHASNNKKALEKMKSAIWNTLPSNTFNISEKDKVGQLKLIEADLNLKKLEVWLWNNFQNKTVTINDIYSKLSDVIYRKKHLHNIIRAYRNNNIVECSDYKGSFAFSKNPTIKFSNQKVFINY